MRFNDSNNAFETFTKKMQSEHAKLGQKKSEHMLNQSELGEVWEEFAEAVQSTIGGRTPQEIALRAVQLADRCLYLHEFMEREDGKTIARKIAEQRRERINNFDVRKVDDYER